LEAEYNVKTVFNTLPYTTARRVRPATGSGPADPATATLGSSARLVEDWDGNVLALFESEWSINLVQQWNPGLAFEPFGARDLAREVPA
jgi:peptide subunit release factor RF-3